MAKRKKVPGRPPTEQAKRPKLSAEESLKRMEEFPERKEQFRVTPAATAPASRPA